MEGTQHANQRVALAIPARKQVSPVVVSSTTRLDSGEAAAADKVSVSIASS
ncbi:MAG: hypothetical protein U0670_18445 [Anaerolineae bacterium]